MAVREGWLGPCTVVPSAEAVLSDSQGGSELGRCCLESSQGPPAVVSAWRKGLAFWSDQIWFHALKTQQLPNVEAAAKAGLASEGEEGERQRHARCSERATQPLQP